ncbi:copper amine oxidase N-terminal domain-containing protein [Paenibacillus hunanensis]|uniref:copper amine oxidase N-terminal domain-containing protein n=1 Tax=Paenibacillus hunanensis TaxID=539262 RepID=UPI002A69B293|nr:copper amine oxidase N-terminal domain-containing protein [Paenibacillus hunanensis]WPP42899.1 copper amine oxidase N-terminal domain-containing protein [Paenibacillus hunanensis]
MNYVKLLVAIMVFALIGMPHSTYAQSALEVSSPPILKINQYYILFTYPTSPYIDQHNRVLVPLRSLSDLLGAKVDYEANSKQATIELNKHQLVLSANSSIALVDQQEKQMDTMPVQKYNALFVPLKVLIDDLAVKGTYHTDTRVIELNDPKYMKYTPQITEIPHDRVKLDEDQNAFAVTSYQIHLNAIDKKAHSWDGSVTYTAKNITGHTIEQGKEDVQASMLLVDGVSQNGEDFKYKRAQRKAVPAGGSITKTKTLIGFNDLAYVIVKPYAVK